MSNEQVVRELEQNIKEARKIVDLHASLVRLGSNRDFNKVITNGYFEAEAIRLVHLKADPSMQTPDRQATIVAQIDAIGALSTYFRTLKHNAQVAAKAIESDEATIEEINAEELNA